MKSLFPDLLKASSLGFENMNTNWKSLHQDNLHNACTSHILSYNQNPEISNFSGVALRKVSSSCWYCARMALLRSSGWMSLYQHRTGFGLSSNCTCCIKMEHIEEHTALGSWGARNRSSRPFWDYLKTKQNKKIKGHRDGSAGRGTCIQAWRPLYPTRCKKQVTPEHSYMPRHKFTYTHTRTKLKNKNKKHQAKPKQR